MFFKIGKVILNGCAYFLIIRSVLLYGIQKKPTQLTWTSSPQAYADLYKDDSTLGSPLIYERKISDQPFVDWKRVR